MDLGAESMMKAIARRDRRRGDLDFVDGTGLATALMGDSIATNLFMLGYAFQKGLHPAVAGRDDARDRAQRRRRREQQADVHLGPARRARSRRGAGRREARAAHREAGRAHAGGDRLQAGRTADRLSGQGLRRALPRAGRQGRESREGQGAGPPRPRRSGRQVALQADGLQGRIRSRTPLQRSTASCASSSTATTRSPSTSRRRCSPTAIR
jgi:hypothetical protein